MAADTIAAKLEVTEVPRRAPGAQYERYVRGEIIDREPVRGFAEGDRARRDPSASRSMINLRYSGGRGSNDAQMSRHPDLFVGFTDHDPRGSDSQPRFETARRHTARRTRARAAQMGANVGHGDVAEAAQPWGGGSLDRGQMELRRRLKDTHYREWFSRHREAAPRGTGEVMGDPAAARGAIRRGAGEGLAALRGARGMRGQRSGTDAVTGYDGGDPRRARRRPADAGAWKWVDLGAALGAGRQADAPGRAVRVAAPGGGRRHARADAAFAAAATGRVDRHGGRHADADAMRRRAAVRGRPGADSGFTASAVSRDPQGVRPAADVVPVAKMGVEDQLAARVVHRAAEVSGGGLRPGQIDRVRHSAQDQAYAASRRGPAAASAWVDTDPARAAARAAADGAMGHARVAAGGTGAGLAPGLATVGVRQTFAAPQSVPATAGHEARVVAGRAPDAPHDRVASSVAMESARSSRLAPTPAASKAPEFTSHTNDYTETGTATTFKRNEAGFMTGGGAPPAGKHLRSSNFGDKGLAPRFSFER